MLLPHSHVQLLKALPPLQPLQLPQLIQPLQLFQPLHPLQLFQLLQPLQPLQCLTFSEDVGELWFFWCSCQWFLLKGEPGPADQASAIFVHT